MNKNTHGPWRVGDAGHTIFGPKTASPSPVTVAHNLRKGDAQFIVRLENAYDEILEALEYVRENLPRWQRSGIENGHKGRDFPFNEKLEMIRAAIAKVKGETK